MSRPKFHEISPAIEPQPNELPERVIDIRDFSGRQSEVSEHDLPRQELQLPDAKVNVVVQIAPVVYDLTPTIEQGYFGHTLSTDNGSRLLFAAQVARGRRDAQTLWSIPGPMRFVARAHESTYELDREHEALGILSQDPSGKYVTEAPGAATENRFGRTAGLYESTAPGLSLYTVLSRLSRARELELMSDADLGLILAKLDRESQVALGDLHGMDVGHNHGGWVSGLGGFDGGVIGNMNIDPETGAATLYDLTRASSREQIWSGPNPNARTDPSFDVDRKTLHRGFTGVIGAELQRLIPEHPSEVDMAVAVQKLETCLVRVVLREDMGIEASEDDAQAIIDAVATVQAEMPTIYYPKSAETDQERSRYRHEQVASGLGRVLRLGRRQAKSQDSDRLLDRSR